MLDCPLNLREPPRICKSAGPSPSPSAYIVFATGNGRLQKQEMPKSTSVDVQARFLSSLLQEREVQPRAVLLAQQITEILPGSAAVVYLLEEMKNTPAGRPRPWPAIFTSTMHAIPLDSGTLGFVAKENQPMLLSGANLVREDYAHLHARRTLLSLAYVPMVVNETYSSERWKRPPSMK